MTTALDALERAEMTVAGVIAVVVVAASIVDGWIGLLATLARDVFGVGRTPPFHEKSGPVRLGLCSPRSTPFSRLLTR